MNIGIYKLKIVWELTKMSTTKTGTKLVNYKTNCITLIEVKLQANLQKRLMPVIVMGAVTFQNYNFNTDGKVNKSPYNRYAKVSAPVL